MFALSIAVCVLGIWGLFMGRVFGPLLVLALSARLALRAPSLPTLDLAQLGITGVDLSPLAKDAQPWFLADDFILLMGALALIEFFCNHVAALRVGVRRFDTLPRAAAAVVAALGLGIARDRSEQRAFRNLAVFVGGFDSGAARAVVPGLTTDALARSFKG